MKNKLFAFKNILWAMAILLSLLILLIGLVFAMSQKHSAPQASGTITLGQIERQRKVEEDEVAGLNAYGGTLVELPSTPKGSLESVFEMSFLCDKTIHGLKTYATNYSDGASAQLWSDPDGVLIPSKAADTSIVFLDGSLITPANAAMVTRPKAIVIYMGADGLATASEKEFVEGYIKLIYGIRNASPNTTIIVCSIASISSNYQGTDSLNPQLISRANSWIRQVCVNTGVYFADLASFLNDENGYLSDSYLMPDGRSIAEAGIALIVDYFRFHSLA